MASALAACFIWAFCPQRSDTYTSAHGCEPEDHEISEEPAHSLTNNTENKALVRSDYQLIKDRAELIHHIICNNVSAAESMLKGGCDANEGVVFQNLEIQTLQEKKLLPLHLSCIYRRPRMVKLLLKYGADTNRRDFMGRLPLQLSLVYWLRNVPLVDDSELTDNERRYQAHLREEHKRSRYIVRALCEGGAQMDVVSENKGEALLHLAARCGLLEATQMLRGYGAPLHVQTRKGMNVLMVAAHYGQFHMVEELVALGADVNTRDIHGQTVIHHLCKENISAEAAQMLVWLIHHGASATQPDLDLSTPLHLAASSYNEAAVEVLLQEGAEADARDKSNRIPIQLMLGNLYCTRGIHLLLNSTLSCLPFLLHSSGPMSPKQLEKLELLQRETQREKHRPLYELLKHHMHNPPSLKRIARHRIRQFVGPQNLQTPAALNEVCPPGLGDIILNDFPIWS